MMEKEKPSTSRMPKREAILEKAKELYFEDCYRHGCQNPNSPESNELAESGFISSAKSELMRNPETKYAEWQNMENFADFQFDLKEAMQTTTFVSGSRGIGKSDCVMMIVDQLKNEGIICVVFDSSLDWLKRSSVSQYETVKPYSDLAVPEQNMIFDISLLSPMEQQRTVESFCKKLFEFQLNSCKRFYVVFEEAQIYFPLNSIRAKRYQNSARILTVGRNVNVSMCAISQFPALVDKELVKHSGQIYIGYCSEPNTLAYWKGILGKTTDQLKTLKNGEFVYYCRNAISKIEIEPYEETTTTKTAIPTTELKPIEPLTINQKTDYTPLGRLAVAIFGFALLIYALGQMI